VFSQFGPLEIVLVIVVLLVIFGPKRLPSLGRQLGTGMREFKDSITGDKRDEREAQDRPELTPAQAAAPASGTSAAPPEPQPVEPQPVDAAPEQRG
jgi:sec-independent protein translocase protein TatA